MEKQITTIAQEQIVGFVGTVTDLTRVGLDSAFVLLRIIA